jgi:hypothetical protein
VARGLALSREGVPTLATDRLDLNGIDLAGLSREDVLAALTDAAIEAYEDAAEFYSPDQARDWRGRWTSGGGSDGGQSVPTHAERGQLRQASLQAVRDYVRAGGQPTQVENEQLAAHLARLTVDQLHQVKAEHGLKASAGKKEGLVAKLVDRFRAHRQTQAPAGKRALEEAVKDRPGFHNVREVVGGHAVSHGPTGSQVRADHAGTRFDVLTSGSTLHSSHATAAAAVRAAEASNRFGTGNSTAEQEHAARQEAMRKSRERAAQAQKPTATPAPAAAPPRPAEPVRQAVPARPTGGGKAGAFDPDAAGQSLRATVERHLETLRAAGGGLSRTSPRLAAAYKAVSVEAEAAVREVVSRAPTAAALRAVARAYGIPALRGKDKEALAAELERAVRSRLQSFIRIHASYEGRRAGFSVAGALSPDEAEERAALRRVESYADSVNARLRAVREGVGA